MSGDAGCDLLISLWKRLPGPHEPGLSAGELEAIEGKYGFRFPPDLRAALSVRVPVDLGFPNWRAGTRKHRVYDGSVVTWAIVDVINGPLEGILFDVEHSGFWMDSLGPRPADLAEAKTIVQARVAQAPRLAPVYGHRYIPDRPFMPGNPVFSVVQTDIIIYGDTLAEYLEAEFALSGSPGQSTIGGEAETRRIEFWSDLV